MTTSIAKLQSMISKLEQKVMELEDRYQEQKEKADLAILNLNQYKKNEEEIVNNAINKAVAKVTEKYKKIIVEKDKRIFDLKCRLNINSSNSSLPSSKNPVYQSKICNSRKPTGDKPGRKNGHKKDGLYKFNDDEITDTIEHKMEKCTKCDSNNLKLIETKNRDEYDIEVVVKKIRHNFYVYKCLDCGEIIKSTIPIELHGENQYGVGIKSLALTLSNYGMISYNRIRKIISGLTDGTVDPSEGYLNKLPKKASNLLDNFIFDVKEKILKSNLAYWDDTEIKIGDKNKACLRVYTNELYVLYKAHMAKNTDGMDEDGILNQLPETCIVMHDHLLHKNINIKI